MAEKQGETKGPMVEGKSTEEGKMLAKAVADGFQAGKAPLKVVTGTQTTSSLNFELKPGAIVAHEGANVIFVCG
jgi:hypothetical protein